MNEKLLLYLQKFFENKCNIILNPFIKTYYAFYYDFAVCCGNCRK